MPISFYYWILMLLWFLFGLWSAWPNLRGGGPHLLLFCLLVMLGWKVFGPPLHN